MQTGWEMRLILDYDGVLTVAETFSENAVLNIGRGNDEPFPRSWLSYGTQELGCETPAPKLFQRNVSSNVFRTSPPDHSGGLQYLIKFC
ncbi:hypothetical protein PILCRDRAFT_122959 [Piloderma croceum F 1598]|uniref:Uncharacterized protein n=1 Tax=Piloderma croceum (strain F 1598) TaxID=765440 RepID=A0A0C3GPF2_PILCF|nr:hypothetical protein PILCRDRAFT_122959 [Piloderma croceum F 1598]